MKTIRHKIKLSRDFDNLDDMFENFKHEGFIQECFNSCAGTIDIIRDGKYLLEPGAKSELIKVFEGIKNHPLVVSMDEQRKFILHEYIKQVFKELDRCKVVFIP